MSLVEIAHGPYAARIAAPWGGRLLSFTGDDQHGLTHYLRPAKDVGCAPTECGCFPLVPFSNRIAGGRFNFRGREISLPRNFDHGLHAIHGYGWISDWQVTAQTGSSATLVFDDHGKGHWPWRYQSSQTISLSDRGLTITLTVQNLSDEDMPAGLGLHPYFNAPDGTSVRLKATGIIEKDSAGLPETINQHHGALAGLRDGTALQHGLDTGIEGWDGAALISWPDIGRTLKIEAPGISRAVYFTPAGRDFFCFEPVTHLTNAHNNTLKTDGGIKILAPQEILSMETRFTPGTLG